jgi:hypothetical protein
VTAKQFNWQVTYPGPDGAPGKKIFLDEMHVPVNKVVRVHLRSQDVIHSFFVHGCVHVQCERCQEEMLVLDEPAAAAVQDRWPRRPTCPVISCSSWPRAT